MDSSMGPTKQTLPLKKLWRRRYVYLTFLSRKGDTKSHHNDTCRWLHIWLLNYMNTRSGLLTLCVGNSTIIGGFPPARVSNVDLWYFICCNAERVDEQTSFGWVKTPWRSCNVIVIYHLLKSMHTIDNLSLSRKLYMAVKLYFLSSVKC